MKARIHCDDGYDTTLQFPENVTLNEVVEDVCNLRMSTDPNFQIPVNGAANISDLNTSSSFANPPTRSLSGFSATVQFVSGGKGYKKNGTVPDPAELQPVSLRFPIKDILPPNLPKNSELIIHVYGFRNHRQFNIVQQFHQFSSKLSLMNMALTNAMEKYSTIYPNSSEVNGKGKALWDEASNRRQSFGLTTESSFLLESSAMKADRLDDNSPVQQLSDRISLFCSEISAEFNEVLGRDDLGNYRTMLELAKGEVFRLLFDDSSLI
jgi:hypothetical protein